MRFTIRAVKVPLATALGDDGLFRDACYPTGAVEDVLLDEHHLRIVEVETGIRVDGQAREMRAFTDGDYLDKTEPMKGGEIGEAIAWLRLRAAKLSVERVEGTDPSPAKGEEFPRPDFAVREGAQIRVIEVKTTDAFSVLRWNGVKAGTQRRPCANLRAAAKSALRQLGVNTKLQSVSPSKPYSLTLRTGASPIPFPADKVTAVAILLRDGRLDRSRLSEVSPTKSCSNPALARRCSVCLG